MHNHTVLEREGGRGWRGGTGGRGGWWWRVEGSK